MQRAQERLVDQPASDAPCAVLNADLALLLCLEAWGFPELASVEPFPLALAGFPVARSPGRCPAEARPARCGACTRSAAKFPPFPMPGRTGRDPLDLVDPRLQDESPAVRRFLALHGPAQLTAAAREGPGRGVEAVKSQDPDPAVAGWVLSLATERLVGGEPVRSDEPPMIVALAALSSRELYRLCYATGQAKIVLAGDPDDILASRPLDGQRKRWFHDPVLESVRARGSTIPGVGRPRSPGFARDRGPGQTTSACELWAEHDRSPAGRM